MKLTIELPDEIAAQLETFASLGGITLGQTVQTLLPDMAATLADAEEVEGLLQSEWQYSDREIMALDARMAAHYG